jgi:hypothetical protein
VVWFIYIINLSRKSNFDTPSKFFALFLFLISHYKNVYGHNETLETNVFFVLRQISATFRTPIAYSMLNNYSRIRHSPFSFLIDPLSTFRFLSYHVRCLRLSSFKIVVVCARPFHTRIGPQRQIEKSLNYLSHICRQYTLTMRLPCSKYI